MTEPHPEAAQGTESMDAQVSSGPTPGEQLRTAREARGLSEAEAAAQLNFLPAYIPALEQEKLDNLHSPTFIKGYLRTYARFLGLDAEQLLASYTARHPELSRKETIRPVEGLRPEKTAKGLLFRFFTLLVLLGLIAVVVLWWQSRSSEPLPQLTSQEVEVDTLNGETIVAPLPSEPTPTLSATAPSAPAVEPAPTTPEPTPTPEPAPVATPAPAPAPTPAPEPAAPEVADRASESSSTAPQPARIANRLNGDPLAATAGGSTRVALRFSDTCWAEVRDSDNRLLLADLMHADDLVLLEGQPPFRVVFGYGHAAEVFYQGRQLDISPRVRPNGYTSLTLE